MQCEAKGQGQGEQKTMPQESARDCSGPGEPTSLGLRLHLPYCVSGARRPGMHRELSHTRGR